MFHKDPNAVVAVVCSVNSTPAALSGSARANPRGQEELARFPKDSLNLLETCTLI